MRFPPPSLRAMSALKAGESTVFQSGGEAQTDAAAQACATKIGGRFSTKRCYLQDHEILKLIPVCIVTCIDPGRALKPRGRKPR